MIRCDTRKRRAEAFDPQDFDEIGYEDMVDAHPRHAARVRRLRPMPLDTGLRVSQSRYEALVCPRARDGVEVARKERRLAAIWMAEPLGAKECVDLPAARAR